MIQWPPDAAALRAGVAAIQRGRAARAYPAAAAAAAAAFARPPLAGALGYTPVLNTLPVDGGVYYDPFLAAHAADPNYASRLQVRHVRVCGDIYMCASNVNSVTIMLHRRHCKYRSTCHWNCLTINIFWSVHTV